MWWFIEDGVFLSLIQSKVIIVMKLSLDSFLVIFFFHICFFIAKERLFRLSSSSDQVPKKHKYRKNVYKNMNYTNSIWWNRLLDKCGILAMKKGNLSLLSSTIISRSGRVAIVPCRSIFNSSLFVKIYLNKFDN